MRIVKKSNIVRFEKFLNFLEFIFCKFGPLKRGLLRFGVRVSLKEQKYLTKESTNLSFDHTFFDVNLFCDKNT